MLYLLPALLEQAVHIFPGEVVGVGEDVCDYRQLDRGLVLVSTEGLGEVRDVAVQLCRQQLPDVLGTVLCVQVVDVVIDGLLYKIVAGACLCTAEVFVHSLEVCFRDCQATFYSFCVHNVSSSIF